MDKRRQRPITLAEKEQVAELLKERIYASFALLAIFIAIDPGQYSPVYDNSISILVDYVGSRT